MRDELHKQKPWEKECAIVNLNSSSENGSHWVAYCKKDKNVLYFDSFGNLKPPPELCTYFNECNILYNHSPFQSYNATDCGHLCLKFLKANT